jgi:hypothetical protein
LVVLSFFSFFDYRLVEEVSIKKSSACLVG